MSEIDAGTRLSCQSVIDLHSHLLPGLDDGARTLEDSREMALRAAAEGIAAIAATPHVREDYPTTPERMEEALDAVCQDFRAHGISVEVLAGGEIDIDMLASLEPEVLSRFTIAGTGRYLLVEFPYRGWPLGLEQRLFDLALKGITPVLAHPERNAEVQAQPDRIRPFVERGAAVQITAASVEGRIGPRSRKAAEDLIRAGLAHVLASDAHTPEIREIGLAGAVDALGDRALADYLTQDAPAAIVAGEALPERPAPARRRLFR
jgi:protein-tyrosine phosphatase